MSGFWHLLVIVLTIASIIGCLWLLFANARGNPGESTTGHVWDDDLREYNNPLPRWWLNLFVITVVFSIGYLVVYPGLGNLAGTFGWTQQSEMQTRLDAVKQKRQSLYASLGDRDIVALAADPAIRPLGREVYLNNCAGCHGMDARGAIGFPNLADDAWLYGGTPEAIVASIANGRQGVMPHFNGMLDAQATDDLVDTLLNWHNPRFDGARRERAMQKFSTVCAACHGVNATGNTVIGAPDLTDGVWLYGGTREAVRHSILFGRNGNMPAHRDLLSADDIRVVAAWIYGLRDSTP
jgi:cytochrome c oxidase cbb3-type subunit III